MQLTWRQLTSIELIKVRLFLLPAFHFEKAKFNQYEIISKNWIERVIFKFLSFAEFLMKYFPLHFALYPFFFRKIYWKLSWWNFDKRTEQLLLSFEGFSLFLFTLHTTIVNDRRRNRTSMPWQVEDWSQEIEAPSDISVFRVCSAAAKFSVSRSQ